jgi:hypothetical protein
LRQANEEEIHADDAYCLHPNPQGLEVDTSQTVKSITDFYTRYPEDRDIYIREVIEQLRKGLTLEQIHNYPFWRHQAPKAKR